MDARTLLDAMTLWEGTGTAAARAAQNVSGLLADNGMPNLITGGLAVQLHGYPRMTVDVDLVVEDIQAVHKFLLDHGYQASVRQPTAVIDPERRVRIDLLPAGKCLKPECQVPFPQPPKEASAMQPVDLQTLISLKLDSWKHTPARRIQDRADAAELIMRNGLHRDLRVHASVLDDYRALWDAIEAEPPGPLS
jgi:hypothetical protein